MKPSRGRRASVSGQTIGQVLEGELRSEWENAALARGRPAWAEEVRPTRGGRTGVCKVCIQEKNSFHREEVKYSLPKRKTPQQLGTSGEQRHHTSTEGGEVAGGVQGEQGDVYFLPKKCLVHISKGLFCFNLSNAEKVYRKNVLLKLLVSRQFNPNQIRRMNGCSGLELQTQVAQDQERPKTPSTGIQNEVQTRKHNPHPVRKALKLSTVLLSYTHLKHDLSFFPCSLGIFIFWKNLE